jgi:ATP-dependent helicase/nuclease subunit A
MSLTKAQLQAVLHGKGNLLVSAGAGSGKTRVLTERVLRLVLEENVPLDRLLILTFTNAAASSMKEKIRQALMKKGAFDEASRVDAAYIMTFDAFSFALVKKYQLELGLQDGVAIYDETLYQVEKKTTLQSMMNEWYAHPNEDFIDLLKGFVIASDQELMNFILKIDAKADLQPDKETYLSTYLDVHFSSTWMDERIHQLLVWIKKEVASLMTMAKTISYEPEQQSIVQDLDAVYEHQTMDGLLNALRSFTFVRSKPKTLTDNDKAAKETIKQQITKLQALVDMTPLESQRRHYEATKPYVKTILSIIQTLNHRLDVKKRMMNRFPFTDIAKMATFLLTRLGKKEECQAMFDYIMVDEYQDTNDLQEAFLSQLANDNMFMVGDVKQSIYRFRNANSDIFSHKLTTYTPYDQAEQKSNVVIAMNQNFRSRKDVLIDINRWFGHLMSVEYGGVAYTADQALDFGQQMYEEHAASNQSYASSIIRYEKRTRDAHEDEPRIIAHDILTKMKQGWRVFDHATSSLRPCRFEDFAILIDRRSNFETYLDVFNEVGIPLDVFAERGLSDSDFFRVIRNVLTVIVHLKDETIDAQYTHAVISVLRSFLSQTTDEELYAYTKQERSLSSFPVMAKLFFLESTQHAMTLKSWFEQVVNTLELEEAILRLPDVSANLARLDGLIQRVGLLSDLGYTVAQFEQFLKAADSLDLDLTIQAPKNTANAVRLMTIHKSKGLEFPVVYLPGLTKKFNMADTKGMYHYSQQYGINLPYPDAVYQYPLFRDLILQDEEDAIISEQVRLWYVALTRAQEKLILIIESSREEKTKEMSYMRSFSDFIHLINTRLGRENADDVFVDVPLQFPTLEGVETQPAKERIKFVSMAQPFEVKEVLRASKVLKPDVDEAVLSYGTYLHECLFLMDFTTMDLKFIPDEKDRHLIQHLVEQPYFLTLKQKVKDKKVTVVKEYAYRDEEGRMGIIDLMVIEGNDVTILDYKTNNIDDPAYDDQLRTYADYVQRLGYTVKGLWIMSLVQATMRKVID